MEENSYSLERFARESTTEESTLKNLDRGVIVLQKSFIDLSREVGVFRALKSFCVRYRYILRLWALREGKILRILCEHYNEVPKWTLSKLAAWLLRTFPALNRLLERQESVLKRKIILNPYNGLTTTNN